MEGRRRPFRSRYPRDHLLLVVLRVAAVVVSAHEGGVVDHAGKIVAEVIADERVHRIARTAAIRTVELGIPAILGQSNVVPDWLEVRRIELDARVDAVIGRAIGWERARVVGVLLVELQPRGRRLSRTRRRTGEPPVIESDAYGSVGCHCQVRLELVDIAEDILVDLDWRTPAVALIVRRGEQHVAEAGALRLVGDVNWIVPGAGRMIANRKRFLDPVFKGRVDIACTGQGWDV